jgi:hypothetical protein
MQANFSVEVTRDASTDNDDDGQRNPPYQESGDSSSGEDDGDDDDNGDGDGDGDGGGGDGDGDGDDAGGGVVVVEFVSQVYTSTFTHTYHVSNYMC